MTKAKAPFLWVAVDGPHAEEGSANWQRRIDSLHRVEGNFGWKVNLDYLLWHGFKDVHVGSRPMFADLKMWNGARTMAQVFDDCHRRGFTAVNAYAFAGGFPGPHGGELKEAIDRFRQRSGETHMRIYAVTALTHYSEEWARRLFKVDLDTLVVRLAEEGVAAGADGIIMPGTMLSRVQHLNVLKVLPGVRPSWFTDTRHRQEVRPEQVAGRTDVEVVCGSPIMKAENSAEALAQLLVELGG